MRPERLPVLLVHGVLGNEYLYWNLFRRRLEADGFLVREVQLPGLLLGDLPHAALFLQRHVEVLAGMLPARRFDLVAHSAGGLVARYYLKRLAGFERVRTCVYMATPHRGTLMSSVLPLTAVARQTKPQSPFIAELNAGEEPPATRFLNLWSRLDGVVLPAENAVLDGRSGNVRNVRVEWTTHWGFLWRGGVYRLVRNELLGGEPAPEIPPRVPGAKHRMRRRRRA